MARIHKVGKLISWIGAGLILASIVVFGFDVYRSLKQGIPDFLTVGEFLLHIRFVEMLSEKGIFGFWVWPVLLILGFLLYIFSPRRKKNIFR